MRCGTFAYRLSSLHCIQLTGILFSTSTDNTTRDNNNNSNLNRRTRRKKNRKENHVRPARQVNSTVPYFPHLFFPTACGHPNNNNKKKGESLERTQHTSPKTMCNLDGWIHRESIEYKIDMSTSKIGYGILVYWLSVARIHAAVHASYFVI